MKLEKVKQILGAKLWTGEEHLDYEVYSACGCDLMSDVLAFASDNVVLLTGLINSQVIRTAEMLDIRVIVFVRGKSPNEEMIKLAKEKDMTIFSTNDALYVACGKLYEAGLKGKGEA